MIISFKHKFIFVAVPKTGTHTVRQAQVSLFHLIFEYFDVGQPEPEWIDRLAAA